MPVCRNFHLDQFPIFNPGSCSLGATLKNICRTLLPLLLFTTLSTAILAQNYSITDLGTLGGDQSQAYAISVNGDVVGYYRSKGSQFHAFLWTRKNGMKDLTPTITGERAFAYAVNNSDEVA